MTATRAAARSDTANIGIHKKFKEVLSDYNEPARNKSADQNTKRQNNDSDKSPTRDERNRPTHKMALKDNRQEKKDRAPASESAAVPGLLILNQWYAVPEDMAAANLGDQPAQEGGDSETGLATPNENSLESATEALSVVPEGSEATAEASAENQVLEMRQTESPELAVAVARPPETTAGRIPGPATQQFPVRSIEIQQRDVAVRVSQAAAEDEVTTAIQTAATDANSDSGPNPDDSLAFATEIGSNASGTRETPAGTTAIQSEASHKDAAQGEKSQQDQQDSSTAQSFAEAAGTDVAEETTHAADIRKTSQGGIRDEIHGGSSLKSDLADSTEHHGSTGGHFSDIAHAKEQATQAKTAASGPPQRSFAATATEESERKLTTPAQGIQLRMNSRHQEGGVDIQVVERGGKLQVAVRTEDPELQSALRDDLGRLVSQVQDQGLKAEVWTPSGGLAHGQTGEFQNESGSSFNQSQSGGQSGGGSNQDRQDERSARPTWLDQLEETFGLRQTDYTEEREWVQILRH